MFGKLDESRVFKFIKYVNKNMTNLANADKLVLDEKSFYNINLCFQHCIVFKNISTDNCTYLPKLNDLISNLMCYALEGLANMQNPKYETIKRLRFKYTSKLFLKCFHVTPVSTFLNIHSYEKLRYINSHYTKLAFFSLYLPVCILYLIFQNQIPTPLDQMFMILWALFGMTIPFYVSTLVSISPVTTFDSYMEMINTPRLKAMNVISIRNLVNEDFFKIDNKYKGIKPFWCNIISQDYELSHLLDVANVQNFIDLLYLVKNCEITFLQDTLDNTYYNIISKINRTHHTHHTHHNI